MILNPNLPVAWEFVGDVAAGKVVASRARAIIMECVQALDRGQPWVGRTVDGPGWSIRVVTGFGAIRVTVWAGTAYYFSLPPASESFGEARINWQARGFVLCPATASNAAYGLDLSTLPNDTTGEPEDRSKDEDDEDDPPKPIAGGVLGWVLVSKYLPNYPEDVFRRMLKLDEPPKDPPPNWKPPPTESKYRTLVRHNRLFHQRDLEEFDRREDGTVATKGDTNPPAVRNVYCPGIRMGDEFFRQYKTYTELEPDFKHIENETPKGATSAPFKAHWPAPIPTRMFYRGLLYKSNAYRADVGEKPVLPPLNGWSDSLAYIPATECAKGRVLAHNLAPAKDLEPPYPGARLGFQWTLERMSAAGAWAGENVLVHFSGLSDSYYGGIKAADSWKESPPHYANMIDSDWSGDPDPNDPEYRILPPSGPELPEYTAAAGHMKTSRPNRAVMTGTYVESKKLGRLYRETGPPYVGAVSKVSEEDAGAKQYAAQVFDLPAPEVSPQGLLRPISYPYEVNRIYSPQLGAGPFSAYTTNAFPMAAVVIHGRRHIVAHEELVEDGVHVVLAAAYRTDDEGETFIRSVIYTAERVQWAVNPAPFPNQTQYVFGYQTPVDAHLGNVRGMHLKYELGRTCKIIVTETPLGLSYADTEDDISDRPAKYTPRRRLVKTYHLPESALMIYGAAVAKDGSKEAILFSCMGSMASTEGAALPPTLTADILDTRAPGLKAGQCGEIVYTFEAVGDGGFVRRHMHYVTVESERAPISAQDAYDQYTRASCVGAVPVGVSYSADDDLQFAMQHIDSSGEYEMAPSGASSSIRHATKIVFPSGEELPTVTEEFTYIGEDPDVIDEPFYEGQTKQLMLLWADWYRPENTAYMEVVATEAGITSRIMCGIADPKVLKEAGLEPHLSTSGWRTWMRNQITVAGDALCPAAYSLFGFDVNGPVENATMGFSDGTILGIGDSVSDTTLARVSTLSMFGPGPTPGEYAYGIRTSNMWGHIIPGRYSHPAQVGTTFYAAAGLPSVTVGNTGSIGRSPKEDAPQRRNVFAVAALDGDVIVEGLWMHIMAGTKYTEYAYTSPKGPTDPQAPGYFRASTFDIESVLGVDAKFTLPFGVIE